MEHSLQEQIIQKENEIVLKICQLEKNEEIGELLMKGSCTRNRCGVQRNEELAKLDLNQIMGYFVHIEKLVLERLQKKTLDEIGQLLALYLDKKELSLSR